MGKSKTASGTGRAGTLTGIECYRGIAALMVVFYHVARHYDKNFGVMPFGPITHVGHAGVDFFFVLSGFIIFHVHRADLGRPARLPAYVAKRFARIFPFYWFVLALNLAVLPFVASAAMPGGLSLVRQILLLPEPIAHLAVGVAWTLQYEVLFYAVFAVLICQARLGLWLVGVWFSVIVAYHGLSLNVFGTPFLLKMFNVEFLFGVMAAVLVAKISIGQGRGLLVLGVLGFLLVGTLDVIDAVDGYGDWARLYYGSISLCLIAGIVVVERRRGLAVPGAGLALGRASYALYLTHLLVAGIVFKLLLMIGLVAVLPYWASALIVIAGCVLAGLMLSRWVELPLSRATRRLLLARKARSDPPSGPDGVSSRRIPQRVAETGQRGRGLE